LEDQRRISECQRIARDLHDVTIQRLFSLGMELQSAQPLASKAVASTIEAAVDVVDELLDDLRGKIVDLKRLEDSGSGELGPGPLHRPGAVGLGEPQPGHQGEDRTRDARRTPRPETSIDTNCENGSTVASGESQTRVFLLEDHEIVRHGLRSLLEADGSVVVVGEAGTARDALTAISATRPRVAILDVRLPDGSGVEICREVRSRHPEVACLILTAFSDEEALREAMLAGASGYLNKAVRRTDLLGDVRKVAAGHSLLDPASTLRAYEQARLGTDRNRQSSLTSREERILQHIAAGLTNRQIAWQTNLSEKTVRNYVSSVLLKLGMTHRTQAAVYAVRRSHQAGRRAESSGDDP
jgi:DNA-binding NarL/FixJ family response regulator